MTVKELMEKLSKYEADADVTVAITIFGFSNTVNDFNIDNVRDAEGWNGKCLAEIVCIDYST